MTHQEGLRKATQDSVRISGELSKLSLNMIKYDLLLGLETPTEEQVKDKEKYHSEIKAELIKLPINALTPLMITRDEDPVRKDIVLLTSASLMMMVSQTLASEYNTTVPGFFEIIKSDSVDTDRIIIDVTESIASYIKKVSVFQLKNPIVTQKEDGTQVISDELFKGAHASAGVQMEEINVNALTGGVETAIMGTLTLGFKPGVIYVNDDITGIRVTVDYSQDSFDDFVPEEVNQ